MNLIIIKYLSTNSLEDITFLDKLSVIVLVLKGDIFELSLCLVDGEGLLVVPDDVIDRKWLKESPVIERFLRVISV